MKKISKALSIVLSVVMIMGALPVFTATASIDSPETPDVIVATGVGTTGDSSDKCYFPATTFIAYEDLPEDQKALYPEGKLIVAYFCHDRHVTTDETDINAFGGDYITVSADNGKTWSEPKAFLTPQWAIDNGLATIDAPQEPRDVVFFQLDEGKTLVANFPLGSATGGTKSYYITSTDAGETWSEPKLYDCTMKTDSGETEYVPYFGANYEVAIFDNGNVLVPFYTHYKSVSGTSSWTSYRTFCILYSWDSETKTFIKQTNADGTPFEHRIWDPDAALPDGTAITQTIMNECSLAATNSEENPGQVFAFSREYGVVYESLDYGATWQAIAIEETSTGGIAQPFLCPLPDGSIMASYALGRTSGDVGGRWAQAKRFYPELGWSGSETKLLYKNDLEMGYAASTLLADGETMFFVSYDVELKSIVGTFANIEDFAPGGSVGSYCGFENYPTNTDNTRYNSSLSSIDFSEHYVGLKSFKTVLESKGIAALELCDRVPIEVAKDTEYTVSFAYKSDSAVSVFAGLGAVESVATTAYGIKGVKLDAADEWTTAQITFTPDKNSSDGYSPAMLLFAETGATVYIDDIYVLPTAEVTGTKAMSDIEFDDSWYPELSAFSGGAVVSNVWDGTVATELKGEGTKESPYLISNGAELAYAISSGGGAGNYYKLTSDIYLNDITKINWSTGAVTDSSYTANKWNYQNVAFQGNINGDGHTVYGLYYTYSGSYNTSYLVWGIGLIPKVDANTSVSISNLGVDCSYLSNECCTSAFVGWTKDTTASVTLSNCYAGEKVTLKSGTAGGMVGSGQGTVNISECYSLADTSSSVKGGFLGSVQNSDLTVDSCYNGTGSIIHTNSAGNYNSISVNNAYAFGTDRVTYVTVITDIANMKGADALTSSSKMSALAASGAFTAKVGAFPVLSVFEKSEETEIVLWDGKETAPTEASGTADDPILINNASELAYIIANGGGTGLYYKLTSDIYLNDITKLDWSTGTALDSYSPKSWYVGKTFEGILDGNGHKVYGLYINTKPSVYEQWDANKATGAALIPTVNNEKTVEVYNLGVDYAYVNYGYTSSAIVGNALNANVTMDSCYAGNNVYLNSYNAGALIGSGGSDNPINISNSYSLATTSGTANNGLLAYANMVYPLTVKNSYNARGPIVSYCATDWTTRYNYTNSYYTEENGTTKTGQTKTGCALLSAENMMGDDALTLSTKMVNLGTAFVTAKRDFSSFDEYIYLPAGTQFADDYSPMFYDFELNTLEEKSVISSGKLIRGAFVKFSVKPDTANVLIPSIYPDTVQLTAEEISLAAEGRAPMEFDLTGDEEIDIRDLVKLNNACESVGAVFMRADINANGTIDADDITDTRKRIFATFVSGPNNTVYGWNYFDTDANVEYGIWLPYNYTAEKTNALFIYNHGHGLGGGTFDEYMEKNVLNKQFLKEAQDRNCVILVPHIKTYAGVTSWWSATLAETQTPAPADLDYDAYAPSDNLNTLYSIITDVKSTYGVDDNRVYITGMSDGAFATWELITRYTDDFTAAITLCGGADSSKVGQALKTFPLWYFHGDNDGDVPYTAATNIDAALKAAGAENYTFTTLAGYGHAIQDKAYSTEGLWDWLFAQTK